MQKLYSGEFPFQLVLLPEFLVEYRKRYTVDPIIPRCQEILAGIIISLFALVDAGQTCKFSFSLD